MNESRHGAFSSKIADENDPPTPGQSGIGQCKAQRDQNRVRGELRRGRAARRREGRLETWISGLPAMAVRPASLENGTGDVPN